MSCKGIVSCWGVFKNAINADYVCPPKSTRSLLKYSTYQKCLTKQLLMSLSLVRVVILATQLPTHFLRPNNSYVMLCKKYLSSLSSMTHDFQNVHILCRPESQLKPRIASLKASGAQVHLGELRNSTIQDLENILKNGKIDIIVSAVNAYQKMESQRNLFQAAKNVGTVKRVIPSDFGFATPPGENLLANLVRTCFLSKLKWDSI